MLVHDGSTDVETLSSASEGDALRLRGELLEFEPEGEAWVDIRPYLSRVTYELDLGQDDAMVLVTGLPADLDPETVVVEGTIVLETTHPSFPGQPLYVILASEIDEPIVLE